MKLSFVIPAYNEEESLPKCLRSIQLHISRSSFDIEVIVVNNASSDGTRDVALSFPAVKVVDEPRKGLVRARQAGFLAASGDLIANIDADTLLPSGWIEKVFEEFSINEKLVGLSGPFIYYDLSPGINLLVKIFYGMAYVAYYLNHYVFKIGAMLQGGNFIIRKSALEKLGGYDTRLDFYGEDADIARRLQKVGQVKFTFQLPIYSSGRRLAAEGVLKMGVRYAVNYLWIIFLKRPYSQKSIDIRSQKILEKDPRKNHP